MSADMPISLSKIGWQLSDSIGVQRAVWVPHLRGVNCCNVLIGNIMKKVLFVCMGNICRSPSAEGIARQIAVRRGLDKRFEFDSAGTHGYHVGHPPDQRSRATALRRGYDLSSLKARQVNEFDFKRFDHIFAMDRENLALLERACPVEHRSKLRLFLDYGDTPEEEVPDPYYGGPEGFERVLDLIENAAENMLTQLSQAGR